MAPRLFSIILLLILIAPPLARAQDGPAKDKKTLAVGFLLGDPSGGSLRYWTSSIISLDAVVGVNFQTSTATKQGLVIGGTWVYNWSDITGITDGKDWLGLGIGGMIQIGDRLLFGPRGKIIIDFKAPYTPFGFYFGIGPWFIINDAAVNLTGGFGFRYYLF